MLMGGFCLFMVVCVWAMAERRDLRKAIKQHQGPVIFVKQSSLGHAFLIRRLADYFSLLASLGGIICCFVADGLVIPCLLLAVLFDAIEADATWRATRLIMED